MGIDDNMGQRKTYLSTDVKDETFSNIESNTIEIHIIKIPFKQGHHNFPLLSTVNGEIADYILEVGSFNIKAGEFFNTGKLPPEGQGSFLVN